MKSFREFCTEAYQVDEGLKAVLGRTAAGAAIGSAINKGIDKFVPKPYAGVVKKGVDIASWGPLAPVAGAVEVFRRKPERKGDSYHQPYRSKEQESQHSKNQQRLRDASRAPYTGRGSDRALAAARRLQRNYQGIGTQKP